MQVNGGSNMGNFAEAYKKLIAHEGGYVNDKDDKGGETYKGIARRFNPNWEGWTIIDLYKSRNDLKSLDKDTRLDKYVQDFYKKEYWDYFRLDTIPDPVAYEIFECAVNTGKSRATTFIQITVNILNKNNTLYPDITVDGKFGDGTYNALLKAIGSHGSRIVYNILNILQGSFYIELMLKNPVYEKYIGWFSRVDIIR
jgi:lysozyme family protein